MPFSTASCGWYDPEQLKQLAATMNNPEDLYVVEPAFYSSSNCQVFQEQTLFQQIFAQSAIATDRISQSPFVKED